MPAPTVNDFFAYLPMGRYIYAPTGEMWSRSRVNSRIAPISVDDDKTISASRWLYRDQRSPGSLMNTFQLGAASLGQDTAYCFDNVLIEGNVNGAAEQPIINDIYNTIDLEEQAMDALDSPVIVVR